MPTMITRRQIDEGRDAPRPTPTPTRVIIGSPVKSTRTGTAQSPATPPSPVGGRVTVTVTPSVSGSGGSGTGQTSGARSSSTRANTGYTPANGGLMGTLGIHMGPTTSIGFGAEAAVYNMAPNDISAENLLYANTKDKADDPDWGYNPNRSGGRSTKDELIRHTQNIQVVDITTGNRNISNTNGYSQGEIPCIITDIITGECISYEFNNRFSQEYEGELLDSGIWQQDQGEDEFPGLGIIPPNQLAIILCQVLGGDWCLNSQEGQLFARKAQCTIKCRFETGVTTNPFCPGYTINPVVYSCRECRTLSRNALCQSEEPELYQLHLNSGCVASHHGAECIE